MAAPYRLCIGMLRPGELRCLCGGPNQLYVGWLVPTCSNGLEIPLLTCEDCEGTVLFLVS